MTMDNTCLQPGEMGRTPPDCAISGDSIINKPGAYYTRSGQEAVVEHYTNERWHGVCGELHCAWFSSGRLYENTKSDLDIVVKVSPAENIKILHKFYGGGVVNEPPGVSVNIDKGPDPMYTSAFHIITGPGTYISREGGTAVVEKFHRAECRWSGQYSFDGDCHGWEWFPCGRSHSDGPEERDIIKKDDRGHQGSVGMTGGGVVNEPPVKNTAPPMSEVFKSSSMTISGPGKYLTVGGKTADVLYRTKACWQGSIGGTEYSWRDDGTDYAIPLTESPSISDLVGFSSPLCVTSKTVVPPKSDDMGIAELKHILSLAIKQRDDATEEVQRLRSIYTTSQMKVPADTTIQREWAKIADEGLDAEADDSGMVKLTLDLPDDLVNAIDNIASEAGLSSNTVVVGSIINYLINRKRDCQH